MLLREKIGVAEIADSDRGYRNNVLGNSENLTSLLAIKAGHSVADQPHGRRLNHEVAESKSSIVVRPVVRRTIASERRGSQGQNQRRCPLGPGLVQFDEASKKLGELLLLIATGHDEAPGLFVVARGG